MTHGPKVTGFWHIAIQYVALVGLPVLGIGLVLHAGADRTAPPDIGGPWLLTAVSRGAVPESCLASVARSGPIPLRISQSGGFISARLTGWRGNAQGRLTEGRLTLDWPDADQPPCVGALRLDGELDAASGIETLTGTIWIPGCQECGTTRFVAERREAEPSGEAR
jgi:hypothetical protein